MGKGKGEAEYWAAVVKPGTILFELGRRQRGGRPRHLRPLAHKLPVHCRFVTRRPTL